MTAIAAPANDTLPTLTNVEAEAALLGGMMQSNGTIDAIADVLHAEDFAEPLFGRIFAAIVSQYGQGRAVNPVTLHPFFAGDEAFAQIGGPAFLARLTGSGAGSVGIKDIAHQIGDLAKRRRLVDALDTIIAEANEIDAPVIDIVTKADEAMNAALRIKSTERSVTMAEAFDQTLQAIDDEAAGLGPQGIKIAGLDDFNSLTGDLRRGELMYLGGRPSMGKTALAIRLALGASFGGSGTLFISLEMRVAELATRAIADLIHDYGESPGYDAIRRGRIDQFARERIGQARKVIESLPLVLTDPSTLNIGRLAMMIRRYKRRMEASGQRLDLVVIDYLGLIKGSDRRAKRYEEVGEISRTLKEVAKECDVAMIVLAQLNRECEKREDKRPMLSDLRDAGDIEQDADQVMFVYRDEYYLERTELEAHDKRRAEWEIAMGYARDRMEIISAKVRNGRVGKRNLYFFAKHQAVRDSSYMRGDR